VDKGLRVLGPPLPAAPTSNRCQLLESPWSDTFSLTPGVFDSRRSTTSKTTFQTLGPIPSGVAPVQFPCCVASENNGHNGRTTSLEEYWGEEGLPYPSLLILHAQSNRKLGENDPLGKNDAPGRKDPLGRKLQFPLPGSIVVGFRLRLMASALKSVIPC